MLGVCHIDDLNLAGVRDSYFINVLLDLLNYILLLHNF